MHETHFDKWSCISCGYEMDTVSHMTENDPPVEGDFCICINCGTFYTLVENTWKHVTEREMEPELRAEAARIEKIRKHVVKEDLVLKQKFRSL
jgi:hypothetical protein